MYSIGAVSHLHLLGDKDDALVEAEGEGARVGERLEKQGLQQLAICADQEDRSLRTLQRGLAQRAAVGEEHVAAAVEQHR